MNKFFLSVNTKKILLIILIGMLSSNCSNQNIQQKNLLINDPFEKYNRKTHQFNKTIDKVALLPTSQLYGKTVPPYFRLGAASFYSNLQEPKRFANHIVQGQYKKASVDFRRFFLNSTVGLLGLFDAASWLGFFPEETDFDETFAYWSVPAGPYLEIPFLGPNSFRGSFGLFADYTVNPLVRLPGPIPNLSLATFEIINIINSRHEYAQAIDSILYRSSDSYALTRLTYFQKSKRIGQPQETIPFELFDPSADF